MEMMLNRREVKLSRARMLNIRELMTKRRKTRKLEKPQRMVVRWLRKMLELLSRRGEKSRKELRNRRRKQYKPLESSK